MRLKQSVFKVLLQAPEKKFLNNSLRNVVTSAHYLMFIKGNFFNSVSQAIINATEYLSASLTNPPVDAVF
jgi:hypothetical protein